MTKPSLRKQIEELLTKGGQLEPERTTKIIMFLFSEVMEEVIDFEYRLKWQEGGWEKGKHGYRVKWYGWGYNQAIQEARRRVEKVIK